MSEGVIKSPKRPAMVPPRRIFDVGRNPYGKSQTNQMRRRSTMKLASQRQAVRIAVAAIVLAAALAALARADETAPKASLAKVKATDNPCLKYLPADWWLVANLDIKVYLDFTASVQQGQGAENPGAAMLKQYLVLAQMYTGIDWTKEVNYATLIVSGDPDGEVSFLAVVKGTFNNALVRGRLATALGQGVKEQLYGGQTIYVGNGVAYCLPAASTVLVGDPAGLKRTIDRVRKAPFKMPPALKSTLDRTNARSVVWAAVRPAVILNVKDLRQWRRDNRRFHKALEPIEYLSVFFEMAEDGFLVNALACLPGAAEAKSLGTYLAERRDALLKKEGANVLFCSFLVMSRVACDERYVKGTLHLTVKAFLELWNTKVIVKPK